MPGNSRHRMKVEAPYRLDLTVTALRRLPTNVVDILTPGGEYVRALDGRQGPILVEVRQSHADLLSIELAGAADTAARREVLALLRRMLGVQRDLTPFYTAARRVSWLRPLLGRGRGLKPPRYPTLWEACVKVILFQQISLQAASTIARRLVEGAGTRLESDGLILYTFPSAERVLGMHDKVLRSYGISPSKLATLRRVGEALEAGELREDVLEELPSPEAADVLQAIKGIGPWSATVILLRGLGRLDVFPLKDTSVTQNLELVSGGARVDVAALMEQLGEQRGMLYYFLLLARLETRGEAGSPSRDGGGVARRRGAVPRYRADGADGLSLLDRTRGTRDPRGVASSTASKAWHREWGASTER